MKNTDMELTEVEKLNGIITKWLISNPRQTEEGKIDF
jgi:hypothetical protein